MKTVKFNELEVGMLIGIKENDSVYVVNDVCSDLVEVYNVNTFARRFIFKSSSADDNFKLFLDTRKS